eukprot:s3904_g2.t1
MRSTRRPGECYEILVGGIHRAEGNYSLSVKCTPPIPVFCGDTVTGSTVGLPRDFRVGPSGSQFFSFCPNTAESAEVNTCGSNFNTWLYITGPGVDSFASSPNAASNCGDQQVAAFDFEAGKCYDIMLGGPSEGNYSLSIDCTSANTTAVPVVCGSHVTGSTLGLPNPRKRHIFCPDNTAAARVSTCGTSFRARLSIRGPGVFLQKDQFGDGCDPNDAVTFSFTSGECYEILVGGPFFGQEGNYALSIDCFIECGSSVSKSSIGLSLNGVAPHLFCPIIPSPIGPALV